MDSAEFVLATKIFGLVHPPGYPLLLLLLQLLCRFSVLSLPFRLNLFSAFAASVSAMFLYLILRELCASNTGTGTTDNELSSLLGSFIWTTSFELWQQATAIEVYAFQVLLFSVIVYISLKLKRAKSFNLLLLLAFVTGLTTANHLFIILWLPFILVIIYSTGLKLPLQKWIVVLLFFLPGPLLYLSLLFRQQTYPNWGGIKSATDFYHYITATVYRYRFFAGGVGYITTQLTDLPKILLKQFHLFWLFIVPGVVHLVKKNRHLLSAIILGVTFSGLGTIGYNIPDKEGYLLPAYFICAIIIGTGIHYVYTHIKKLQFPLTLTLLTVIAGAMAWFYPRQDRSHISSLPDLARAVATELPPDAILFTNDYSLFHGLNWYLIEKDDEKRVLVISEHHLAFPWYLEQLSTKIPVPPPAFSLARNLWKKSPASKNERFGEIAATTVEEIKLYLSSELINNHRIFYFPRDFTTLQEKWRGFRLKMRGLTYEFSPADDTIIEADITFYFPGPEKYHTTRFYDPYTEDLCRRFAATANRRGILRYARGRVTEAINDFNLALAYYPDYPEAIENKGLVFALENQPDSARIYLTLFLELSPNSPEINKVKQFLNSLPETGND